MSAGILTVTLLSCLLGQTPGDVLYTNQRSFRIPLNFQYGRRADIRAAARYQTGWRSAQGDGGATSAALADARDHTDGDCNQPADRGAADRNAARANSDADHRFQRDTPSSGGAEPDARSLNEECNGPETQNNRYSINHAVRNW